MTPSQGFRADVAAVGSARSYVDSLLGDLGNDDLDAVRLMVSELAANSVRHAHSPFRVTVLRQDGHLRVEVNDAGAGTPAMRSPAPSVASGRGLRIVDSLSDAWGVDELPDGTKTVWFTFTPSDDGAADDGAAIAVLPAIPSGRSSARGAPSSNGQRAPRPARPDPAGPRLSSVR